MTAESLTQAPVEGRHSRKWLALALIVTAQFMVVLDVAIVNVALPSIKLDLHFSQESLQWVITAYAIMFGGFLMLGGRLADVLGRRRLFRVPPVPAPRLGASAPWLARLGAPLQDA